MRLCKFKTISECYFSEYFINIKRKASFYSVNEKKTFKVKFDDLLIRQLIRLMNLITIYNYVQCLRT